MNTICPIKGHPCPRTPCPGQTDPGICRHVAALAANRARQEDPEAPPVLVRRARESGPVRVGILAPCFNQGGAEAWGNAMARATAGRLAWAGTVVLADESRANPEMVRKTRELMPVEFGLEAAVTLASRVDVLLSWAATMHRGILDRVSPAPKVIYWDHFPHDEVYVQPMRDCLDGVSHIVGVSELCEPGFPPEFSGRASIIWNAVDPEKLAIGRPRAEMHRLWGVPAGAKVAGFYSRLAPEKRPCAMIRLAAALPADWHVVLVGDCGPYRAERARIEAAIAGLEPGIAARVHLPGPDSAAGDVLNAFDALVVPPEVESFGLTMAEGLWMGRPIVSTRVGVAKIHPELTYPVALDATGEELARAVCSAASSGPRPGSLEFARARFAPARFSRRCARLIEKLADPPNPNDPFVLGDKADRCEHGSGPCGCGAEPRTCSRPDRAGPKWRWECIECQTTMGILNG